MDMDLANLFVGLSAIFVALAVYFHFKIFSFWSSRGIPGPMPWPIFGTNGYYLFANKIALEAKWKEKYGRTYGLFEGYSPMLRTSDAEVTKQVFIKQFQSYTDRNHKFIKSDNMKRWMFWTHGDQWANQRALVSPMFSAIKMRNIFPTMSAGVDKFIKHVDEKIAEQKSSQFASDKFHLSALTLDVISSSFFGLKLDTYKVTNQPDKLIDAAYRLADFEVIRFFNWLCLPRQISTLLKYDLVSPIKFKYFNELCQKIIGERRKKQSLPKRNDVIQALIDAKLPDKYEPVFSKLDDKEAHYNADIKHRELEQTQREQSENAKHFRTFSDDEIIGQMTFFFVAGFETTASTLSFALYELANQPKVQEKVLTELIDCFGPKGEQLEQEDDLGNNYAKLLDLKFLDAVVSEVLRLYSPILDHTRMVTAKGGSDLVLDQESGKTVHLPQGTPIAVSSFLIQRDSEYFEHPNEFDVSRFCSENRAKIKTGIFVPFGLGPRYCVGMRFALLEVKLALTKLLLRFQICPDETNEYPPKFKQNAVFLQFQANKFKFVPRETTE